MFLGRCFLCGRYGPLENHHIFGGANRRKSERFGLKVGLCADCHRNGHQAAHRCAATAQKLHEYGQRKYMQEQYATIDDFITMFVKNYLDS